jgi:hypothetical protein
MDGRSHSTATRASRPRSPESKSMRDSERVLGCCRVSGKWSMINDWSACARLRGSVVGDDYSACLCLCVCLCLPAASSPRGRRETCSHYFLPSFFLLVISTISDITATTVATNKNTPSHNHGRSQATLPMAHAVQSHRAACAHVKKRWPSKSAARYISQASGRPCGKEIWSGQ